MRRLTLRLIDSSPTEMNEPHPNGFLFKGEAEDKIRAGGDCDLSLATQFGERYEVYTRRESIPKMFTNLRSTCVTELVKIFGFDKHSVCRWIGHAEYIQDEHYLQMMDDDHAAAMSNLSTGKINPQINPSGTGSYLSEMVFIALHRNLPELVEAATEHALGITKIGKNKMFGTPAVRATPVWSPPRELVESSGGGTRICGRFSRKELHSLQSWGQTGDNFGQREVLMRWPPPFQITSKSDSDPPSPPWSPMYIAAEGRASKNRNGIPI
jgi:hypothetical protein